MSEILTKKWNEPVGARDGTRIFVARYRPRYLRKSDEPWDEWRKELAPSRELHAAWYGKGGRKPITFDEFVRRYGEEIKAQQDSIRKLAGRVLGGETLTLLCYCADASRCHRTLLKSMIELAAKKGRQAAYPRAAVSRLSFLHDFD